MTPGPSADTKEDATRKRTPFPFFGPVHSLLAGWTGLARWLLLLVLLAFYPYTGVSTALPSCSAARFLFS